MSGSFLLTAILYCPRCGFSFAPHTISKGKPSRDGMHVPNVHLEIYGRQLHKYLKCRIQILSEFLQGSNLCIRDRKRWLACLWKTEILLRSQTAMETLLSSCDIPQRHHWRCYPGVECCHRHVSSFHNIFRIYNMTYQDVASLGKKQYRVQYDDVPQHSMNNLVPNLCGLSCGKYEYIDTESESVTFYMYLEIHEERVKRWTTWENSFVKTDPTPKCVQCWEWCLSQMD